MKTVTINFTHNEVFEDFVEEFTMSSNESKYITIEVNENSAVMNITGTLGELENE